MKYFVIEPEVAGGLGEKSEMLYENGKIKDVMYLDYEFQGWLGDDILTTHPCFIISKPLFEVIRDSSLCGYRLDSMNVSFSDEYRELHKDLKVPEFMRIIPSESIRDTTIINTLSMDFYLYKNRYLVVSETVLQIIRNFHIANCTIYEVE